MAILLLVNAYDLLFDLLSALIIIISCFLIYFKTRELYDLSLHRGIKYFRNTFLFFGITYFIRFLFHSLKHLRGDFIIFRPLALGIFDAALFVMIYTSSMALLSLIYSMFWKKIDRFPFNKSYFPHIIALLIALASIIDEIDFSFMLVQGILFVVLLMVSLANYRRTRKKGSISKIYLIYPLMFGLLILSNILELITSHSLAIGLLIYAIFIPIFIILLSKVLRELNLK